MKTYECSVPVLGIALVTVVAGDEEEALLLAVNNARPDDVDIWESHHVLVEGNFYYGAINRARVDNVYDEEED